MKKATILVEEKYIYTREIEIEVPDEMTDRELENIFNAAERRAENTSDIIYALNKQGVKCGSYDDDMDSPDSMGVEITEYEIN